MPEGTDLVTYMLSQGGLGCVVVAVTVAYLKKDRALTEALEKRVTEATDSVKTMMITAEATRDASKAIKENTKAIQELGRRM